MEERFYKEITWIIHVTQVIFSQSIRKLRIIAFKIRRCVYSTNIYNQIPQTVCSLKNLSRNDKNKFKYYSSSSTLLSYTS